MRRLSRKLRWIVSIAVSAATVVLVSIMSGSTASSTAADPAPACVDGTTVQTNSGPVCGITANNDAEWLGIPYAAAPVGDLRWASPQPPTPWTSPLAATAFGSSCTFGGSGSENCLFLNVTRPNDGSTALPVLVHIHGGAFIGGSGNGDYTLLANTGHEVVVSINYRLGIFGFLAGKQFGDHSGDWGLQDQQAALRWVQQNIANFGGDPSNVTIYGESAGGSSVCDAIASPTAKGLFKRGISVSGEYNTLLGVSAVLETQDCKSNLPSQAQANAAGRTYAEAAGCTVPSQATACLRQLSTAQAQAVAGSGFELGGQGTVGPTINGTTLTQSLRQALETGKVNKVQVIAGTDRDENLSGNATTAADYVKLVDTQYGINASQVMAKYPLSHFGSPAIAWRTVAADSNTVCPALRTDADLAKWMPVHAYEIDDNDIPPYSATNAAGSAPGASHVGAWFLSPTATALDANQQALQNEEVATVTQFARDGSVTPAGTPAWPTYNKAQQVMSLQPAGDSELVTTAEMAAQHNCGFWDKLAPQQ
jgi:para-nitrobenzyl esterase